MILREILEQVHNIKAVTVCEESDPNLASELKFTDSTQENWPNRNEYVAFIRTRGMDGWNNFTIGERRLIEWLGGIYDAAVYTYVMKSVDFEKRINH